MRAATQAVPGGEAPSSAPWLRGYDPVVTFAVSALLGLGLVMVASASISTAARELDQPLYYFWRQLVYAALGAGLMAGTMRTPLAVWHRASPWLLLLGIAMLALVLVPGSEG